MNRSPTLSRMRKTLKPSTFQAYGTEQWQGNRDEQCNHADAHQYLYECDAAPNHA
jgi:hypothetical protein